MQSSAVRRILASWSHTLYPILALAASVCPLRLPAACSAHNSSMSLPSSLQAQHGSGRSLGTHSPLVCCSSSSSSSNRHPGLAAGPRRVGPRQRLQQLHHRLQQAAPTQLVPVQQQQQQQQRQRRQTFSSPAGVKWQRIRMLSGAAGSSATAAAKPQPQQLRAQHTQGVSSHGMAPVIAAASSAADSDEHLAVAAAGADRSSNSDLQPADDPALQQQQQQPQQQQQQSSEATSASMPPWHDFSSSSSNNGRGHYSHHHHQHQQQHQQQQAVLQELQALPSSTGAVAVDITHLLNLQQQADQEEPTWSTSSNISSKGSRKKLTTEQQQLQMLERTGLQQLLWVTIHQPRGGRSPAAVWVKPWPAELAAESLQFSDVAAGRVSVLFEAQARPDVGQQPMAVVEGLRFCHQAPVLAGSSSSSAAAGAAPDSSSSSSSDNSTVGRGNGAAADSSSSDGSSGGVYDFLLLCAGDFSPLEHENMFPNAMVHCGDGRQLHSARGVHDVAAFVAEPDAARIHEHCLNLLRCAWDLRDSLVTSGHVWAYERLVGRWGPVALARFGVDLAYVNRCLGKVIPLPPLPTGPRSAAAAGAGGNVQTAAAAGSVQAGEAADASVVGAAATTVPVPV